MNEFDMAVEVGENMKGRNSKAIFGGIIGGSLISYILFLVLPEDNSETLISQACKNIRERKEREKELENQINTTSYIEGTAG